MDLRERLQSASSINRAGRAFRVLFLCVGLFFACASICFLVVAAMQYKASARYRADAVAVEAKVLSVQRTTDPADGGVVYVPHVGFRDKDGGGQAVTLPGRADADAYHEGDTVHLLYLPAAPYAARVDDFRTFYLLPVLLASLGGTVLLLAIVFLVAYAVLRRKNRPEKPAPAE